MGRIVGQKTLAKGLKATFMSAYDNQESPSDIMPLILETTSTAKTEEYGWLGNVPSMVEWIDNRQRKGLIDFDYTIPNKHN